MTYNIRTTTSENINVKFVSQEHFQDLKDQARGILEVPQDNWVQAKGNIPVLNDGASTCALIYVICAANNETLAGHFIPAEMSVTDLNIEKQLDLEMYIRKLGSAGILNILSQTKSREIMRRIEDANITLQMFSFLNLAKFL